MSAITKSARGEHCTIRIPYVCLGTTETVVWAHANGSAAGKGIGQKSHDILGAYACHACHDMVDGRRHKDNAGLSVPRTFIDQAFADGHFRSLIILIKKGIVCSK